MLARIARRRHVRLLTSNLCSPDVLLAGENEGEAALKSASLRIALEKKKSGM